MNTLRFFALLCVCACWPVAYSQSFELSSSPVPHKEFTGKDAELIIAALGRMSLAAQDSESTPSHGFHLNSMHCRLVPSPRATANCVLIQGNLEIEAGPESAVIFQNFVRNGATLQLVDGVSELTLSDIECLSYDIYRGVSKCFFLE